MQTVLLTITHSLYVVLADAELLEQVGQRSLHRQLEYLDDLGVLEVLTAHVVPVQVGGDELAQPRQHLPSAEVEDGQFQDVLLGVVVLAGARQQDVPLHPDLLDVALPVGGEEAKGATELGLQHAQAEQGQVHLLAAQAGHLPAQLDHGLLGPGGPLGDPEEGLVGVAGVEGDLAVEFFGQHYLLLGLLAVERVVLLGNHARLITIYINVDYYLYQCLVANCSNHSTHIILTQQLQTIIRRMMLRIAHVGSRWFIILCCKGCLWLPHLKPSKSVPFVKN